MFIKYIYAYSKHDTNFDTTCFTPPTRCNGQLKAAWLPSTFITDPFLRYNKIVTYLYIINIDEKLIFQAGYRIKEANTTILDFLSVCLCMHHTKTTTTNWMLISPMYC